LTSKISALNHKTGNEVNTQNWTGNRIAQTIRKPDADSSGTVNVRYPGTRYPETIDILAY
jgi:hypothetical protein